MSFKDIKDKFKDTTDFDEIMMSFARENMLPFKTLMARYNCAMMEAIKNRIYQL